MARLLIYKDFFTSGRGADRATAMFANTMAKCGYEIHVVTKHEKTRPFSVTFDESITCHSLPERKRPFMRQLNKILLSSGVGEWILAHLFPKLDLVRCYSQKLQCLIEEITPDIVIVAGANECVDALLAGKLKRPVLMMFHVFPLECFRKNKFRRATRLKRVLQDVDACQVLLPSHCATLKTYTSAPIIAIGNGIAWSAEEPLPPFASREKTIVYIAYFSKDKNHTELLQAFAQLDAPDWTLHLYGSGTPEWEARLKILAVTLGIADRVHFMGITQVARPILLRAGICAYPSKVEGFGLALAEAMWCGLPCVGFADAPGVNELLAHEANGLLAGSSPEAFATQLQRLIDNADLREHLGEVAARTARRLWAQTVNTQQWNDFLMQILAQHHANPSGEKAETTTRKHVSSALS